jgi:multiple sugar transport system substrate-binding protein
MRHPDGRARRLTALVLVCGLVASACGGRGTTVGETQAPTATAAAGSGGAPASVDPASITGTLNIWTFPQGDDEVPIKAYIEEFTGRYPNVTPELLVIAEGDPYAQKINTALRARNPPEIAVIEDRSWMKAGRVMDVRPHYEQWGVKVEDFAPGGLSRATVDGDVTGPIYGVGDFLGGNVLVYNKALFDAAGVEHPPADRSVHISEYADICRKIGKPDPDPNKAIYGCSMPEWSIGIQAKDVFGPDGRMAVGNLNSPQMVEAWSLASALVRDKLAPSGEVLEAAAESDRFAAGQIGITWTDFTEVGKYEEQGIDFGIAPFFVIHEGDNFVETWTAPWGVFNEAPNMTAGLEFLKYLATDGQRKRLEMSEDPSLSTVVANEAGYGNDDPVKKEYLAVLEAAATPQVFVPPGVEAWDPAEVLRLMTVENQTDAKPILDEMATAAQEELDSAWEEWDELGD